nr:hypothetical protein GCM10011355_16500 [Aquisalinus luteolus]
MLAMAFYMIMIGRPASCLFSLGFAAIAIIGMSAQFRTSPASVEQPDMRIVWANVFHKPSALKRVIQLAEKENADLVLLAEYDGIEMTLPDNWQYRLLPDETTLTKVVILSRGSVDNMAVMDAPFRPVSKVTIETPAGVITVGGIHPHTPMYPSWNRHRNADITAAMKTLGEHKHAVLVGDFNTVPWSQAMIDAERESAMRRVPYGPWSSWMGPLPFFGLPIDHTFVTNDLEAHVRVGRGTGSDHLPLIIDVRILK